MLVCHQSFEKTSVDKVSSTPDLFPTILEMFGIDPELPFIGQSMFQDSENVALLPTGVLLYQSEDHSLLDRKCDRACNDFFVYTDQHIKVSK